jgi:molybdopterin molybdotransferase
LTAGERVIPAGVRITPAAVGLLATVGAASVRVFRAPEVAVLTTGDEVIEPDGSPGPFQLRNSNGPMLVAQTAQAGARPCYLGIAGDDRSRLEALIGTALTKDVVILSGGVSAGRRDLVPDVVQSLGVEVHFHKVAMKPGKPLLFGTRGATLVFGLPGNPVSSFAGFELFVRPALRGLSGERDLFDPALTLPLAEPIRVRGDRPTYHPARTEPAAAGEVVRPLAWSGSPDLKGLVGANAFAVFPAGDGEYAAGQRVSVVKFRE